MSTASTLTSEASVARRSVDARDRVIAPVSGWRRALGDSLLVAATTAACHVLAAVTALALRMLLDPSTVGVWQGLKLWLGYSNLTSLGTSKGAALELATARGHGDTDSAQHSVNVAFTVGTLMSVIYGLILAAAGVWIAWRASGVWSQAWGVGLVAMGLLAVAQRYVTYQVTLLRARQCFAATSRLAFVEAALTLVVCGICTWLWGLAGLVVGTIFVVAASWWWLSREGADRLAFAWDSRRAVRLMIIGGPILLSGMLAMLLRSIDRLMILALLPDPEFQLGCYSAALMVATQSYGLANVMSIVMGPRYSELYGRLGDQAAVARLAARASELQAAGLALLAGVVLVAAPALLERVLPDYSAGLPSLAWLMPGVVASGMAIPLSQSLLAVGRQRIVLWALAASLVIAVIGNGVALRCGYGLIGVAAATTAANVGYLCVLVAATLGCGLAIADKLRYTAIVATLLGPTLLLGFALATANEATPASLRTIAWNTASIVFVWGTMALLCSFFGGWARLWREEHVR